jgi:hypothetical protein
MKKPSIGEVCFLIFGLGFCGTMVTLSLRKCEHIRKERENPRIIYKVQELDQSGGNIINEYTTTSVSYGHGIVHVWDPVLKTHLSISKPFRVIPVPNPNYQGN